MNKGQIHIYCGDGKGKTTAAIGLGIRACGSGKRVLLVQFLKGNTSSELTVLRQIANCTVMDAPSAIKFTFQMSKEELEQTADLCETMLQGAMAAAQKGDCDLVILDEVFGALSCKLLNKDRLAQFIQNKPPQLELVLTGRDPSKEFLDLADYVTEMKKIKHPYDKGMPARKGIEY
jgi:cob(I)alamin adenosyltransferase